MLIATIITYDDFPLIKDCIESIEDKVDKIVIVDGKFEDFSGEVEPKGKNTKKTKKLV